LQAVLAAAELPLWVLVAVAVLVVCVRLLVYLLQLVRH
jgi:hypothetical protein